MRHNRRGKTRVASLALGFVLVLSPLAGHALGLGRLTIHSALNEPLNAEIDFTSITEQEANGLVVSLPTRSEFETAGVERQPYQSQIQYTVAKRLDGHYFLQLKTDAPIEEPFLHLLLQVEWPGGKLVREYTALIDPPYQIAGQPAAVEPPVTGEVAPAPTQPPPSAPAEPVAAAPVTQEEAEAKPETAKAVETSAAEQAPAQTPEQPVGPTEAPAPQAVSSEAAKPQEQAEVPKTEALPPPKAESAPAVATTVPSWTTMDTYRVRQGDTLWQIADKARADKQVSLEQVMLALYRSNRDAFFGNNVNNLKAGKILTMPEREQVVSVSPSLARREFRAQYDAWQEYKLKLASTGRTVTVATEHGRAPAAIKGEVTKAAPAEATPTQETPAKAATPKAGVAGATAASGPQTDELLKIVRSNLEAQKKSAPGKQIAETEAAKDNGAVERQALADRVTTLEESLLSSEMEQKELGEKIGQVRSLLKKESRLIEIESKEAAPAPKAETEMKSAEVAKIEPAKPAEKPKSEAVEVPKAAAPAVTSPPKPAKEAAPRRRHIVAPPPAPEEKGFLASLVDELGGIILPVVVGVVVLLSGGIALVYMRRRRKSIAEFEESILSSEAISSESASTTSEATTTGAQAAGTGDTSFLSDFSQGGMGTMHTDEVDPIAEAEVYLAYGRDETAEEILKDAVIKNPQREELKVKLLEIYRQRNDVKAFETLAEEYYAQLGGRPGKLWEKVEEMGRKLNPENPMFRGGVPARRPAPGAGKPAAAVAPSAPATATFADARPGLHAPAAASAPTQTVAAPMGTDSELDTAAPAASAEHAGLDFDLGQTVTSGSIDFEEAPRAGAPDAEAAVDTGFDSLDFGKPADNMIEFDAGGAGAPTRGANSLDWEAVTSSAPAAVEEVALAEPAVPAGEEAAPSQWDETATKLDLAKAYIDMGDAEGARSILNEVIAEGNDAQKKQAQELAAQIG